MQLHQPLSPRHIRQKLWSNQIEDHESFLHVGAEVDDPCFVLLYNEILNDCTYRKVVICEDRTILSTTAPIGLLLGIAKWRFWRVGGHGGLYIAYDPLAINANAVWEDIRSIRTNFPRLHGDMVLFRHLESVDWSADVAIAKLHLLTYLKCVCNGKNKFFE